jgi:sugar diacid utilization regulator
MRIKQRASGPPTNVHTRTLDYRLQRVYELTGLPPAGVSAAADERLVLATSACPTTSPPRRD